MKIIIALDSFKGTFTASKACQIVSDTIRSKVNADIVLKPMADGGEGTAEAMLAARAGLWIPQKVVGPLPDMEIKAGFVWFENDKEALVEMASASGITLLSKDRLNPMKTTTYGTGQLIKSAAEYGAQKILLAVGGSATVDGGVGAAIALDWQFLDGQGKGISLGAEGLADIQTIIKPDELELPPIEVLSDVDNPLCGPSGAAKIYGPQKGASPETVELLEEYLFRLSELIKLQLNKDIQNIAGSGAAGGLGAGAIAFMNAKIVSGINVIIKESGLEKEIQGADWIITGEGSFDHQSLMGKVISGICKIAKHTKAKVAVIAGQVLVEENEYKKHGIWTAISCKKNNMSFEYAFDNSERLLVEATRELISRLVPHTS